MGGFGTWLYGAKNTSMFSCLAPICGGGRPRDAAALSTIPIWAFHGDADTTVPIDQSRKMVKAVTDAGGDVKFTVYEDVGHNSWDKAYGDEKMWAWLFAQKRDRQ